MGATPFSRLIVSTGIQFRVHGGNLLSGLHLWVESFLSYKYKKEEIFISPHPDFSVPLLKLHTPSWLLFYCMFMIPLKVE